MKLGIRDQWIRVGIYMVLAQLNMQNQILRSPLQFCLLKVVFVNFRTVGQIKKFSKKGLS